MVGTLVYLLSLVLLLGFVLTIVFLPLIAIGFHFWKWKLPRARRGTLVQPSEPFLCRFENSNG